MPLTFGNSVGSLSAAFNSFDNSGLNTDNAIAWPGAKQFPGAGRIARISGYFAGNGGPINAILVAWQNIAGLPILETTLGFVAAAGTLSTGGQAQQIQIANGNVQKVRGADISVFQGWWRQANQAHIWSVLAGGTFQHMNQLAGGPVPWTAGVGCGAPYVCGDLPLCYIDVTGGDAKAMSQPYFRAQARRR